MVLIVSISPYSLLNRQLSVYKFIIVVHVILCYSFFMYIFVNDFYYFQGLLTYHLNDCMISCIKILLLYPVQLILVEDSHVILSSNVYLHHSLLLVLCRRNEKLSFMKAHRKNLVHSFDRIQCTCVVGIPSGLFISLEYAWNQGHYHGGIDTSRGSLDICIGVDRFIDLDSAAFRQLAFGYFCVLRFICKLFFQNGFFLLG